METLQRDILDINNIINTLNIYHIQVSTINIYECIISNVILLFLKINIIYNDIWKFNDCAKMKRSVFAKSHMVLMICFIFSLLVLFLFYLHADFSGPQFGSPVLFILSMPRQEVGGNVQTRECLTNV